MNFDRAMKILHVNENLIGGGGEQYLAQLLTELERRGFENVILYGGKFQESPYASNVRCLHIEGITASSCSDCDSKLKLVDRLLREEQPDVAYIHEAVNCALIDKLTIHLPSIRFFHGLELVCPNKIKVLSTKHQACHFPLMYKCQLNAYLYRCMPRNPFRGLFLIYNCKRMIRIYQKRTTLIAPSRFVKSVLLCNGFYEGQIIVIPPFTYLPQIQSVLTGDQQSSILALGRIVPEKGMHFLLRAFSRINYPSRLVIVGTGPDLDKLKTLARDMGILHRVDFPGWLPHERLHELYRRSSVVVVPSIVPETFGMVGIEAMAYQKPVVAFDVGGIAEWLSDGKSGFLVKPGDEMALSEKIELLLSEPSRAKEMGKRGRETVEQRFNLEVHLNSLISAINHTVNRFHKNTTSFDRVSKIGLGLS